MKHDQRIGHWVEALALAYLNSKGYKIVAQNLRTPHGEIDILTCKKEITVFVEVKTPTSKSFGHPEEAVNLRKQEHMLSCAEHYAREHEIDHWQFDVIAITGKPGSRQKIEHFENAIG